MTDEQLGMMMASLLQLNRGFREVANHILEQEAEIDAIRSVLERKGIAPSDDLDRARDEAVRRLKEGFPAISKRKCRRDSRHSFGADPRTAA
jgi:hypothetical protein